MEARVTVVAVKVEIRDVPASGPPVVVITMPISLMTTEFLINL